MRSLEFSVVMYGPTGKVTETGGRDGGETVIGAEETGAEVLG